AAADKAAFEKKQNDDLRFRARDLQNQINWWNQQRGMGQYEEPIINATIYKLQNELNGIPAAFWT
ncbi:MAG: hypothetical protein HGA90_02650, partial [Alphaproteobacteria bacterium]|nr:hypothetical protein [Alphaproteobacteria bacterium]